VPSVSAGNVTAAIAGTTGTSGLGTIGLAVARLYSGHPVPDGLWAVSASLALATALIGCLHMLLDYRLKKFATELQKERLAAHRTMLEKAACEPGSAENYRKLILANALYLSVEQNGSQPIDRTHAQLYGPHHAEAD
jgi:hypothetical protein